MDQGSTPRGIGSENLPEGVEIRDGTRGRRLRITFYWMSQRRRETLDIPVTAANIRYADRLRGEIQNQIERGTFDYAKTFPNSRMAKLHQVRQFRRYLVEDLVAGFIDAGRKTQSLSPSSIACYARWAKARIIPVWGHRFADDLTPGEMREWIIELVGELAPKSVRNCVGLLSAVFNQAMTDQKIQANPLAPIKLKSLLPKRKSGDEDKIDPFNDTEIAAILAACKNDSERSLWQFAFSTGARIGELIAFKWSNVDWLTSSIRIKDNVVSAEVGTVEKSTKTEGSERDIPLLPGAREAIERMRPISQLASHYVFTNPRGGGRWRDEKQLRDHWTTILRRAGIRYRNPYQTRHTFASRLLMAGEPELLVAKLLGHTTVEMIRRTYGHYIKQPEGIVLRGDYSNFSKASESAPTLPQIRKAND